jgi:hypothetical protein
MSSQEPLKDSTPAPPRRPRRRKAPRADALAGRLQEVRSVLAVAARALDECVDPSQLDAPEEIDGKRVANSPS